MPKITMVQALNLALQQEMSRDESIVLLGEDIGPEPYGRPYDLNRLRDRYFCLETDPEDGLSAAITSLRVKSLEWGKIGLEPLQNGHVHDIYDMADHCLNGETVPWDQIDILKASFRFRFDPLEGRRAGSLRFGGPGGLGGRPGERERNSDDEQEQEREEAAHSVSP